MALQQWQGESKRHDVTIHQGANKKKVNIININERQTGGVNPNTKTTATIDFTAPYGTTSSF